MPAILCEGLFMMLPDQEAALRSPEGQRRYAVAVLEGMVEFLKQTGTTPIP
jgi:N-acetylmuramoyl-L-alanine amidase